MSKMHSGPAPAFLCDQNLGRLVRWLRMMGFDAEFMRTWDGRRIRDAVSEGRVFLTRKRSMASSAGCIVIEDDRIGDQLACLGRLLGLGEKAKPFSRCSICNQPLKYVKADDVKDNVPEYVTATQEGFAQCPVCSRIYWRGTHTGRSLEFFFSQTGVRKGA